MSARAGGLAGSLSGRVTIERRDEARDTLAGAGGAWRAIATRWAAVTSDGSGEDVVGEAGSARPRFRVMMRAGAPLLFGDRLLWRGRELRVRVVVDDPAFPDRIVVLVEEMA